jgi:CBS domain-containing protein
MEELAHLSPKDLLRVNPRFRELVHVNQKTTIEECIKLLVSKDILSVPVLNTSDNSFIGSVDVQGIVWYIAFASFDVNSTPTWEDIVKNTDLHLPVTQIMTETVVTVKDDSRLKETLEWLAQGTGRILVTHNNLNPVMLTQTDLIRFIHLHIDKYSFMEATIENAHNEQVPFLKNVHSVGPDVMALQVFRSLSVNELEAIPIVDGKGVLIGSFSAGILRGFTYDKVKDLFLPVSEFTSLHGGKNIITSKANLSTTLSQVVQIMVRSLDMSNTTHLRYVWVVDDDFKPKGLVSMTDIANYFYIHTLPVWNPT